MMPADKKYLLVKQRIEDEFDAFRARTLKLLFKEVGRLDFSPNADLTKNLRVRAEILRQYQKYEVNWIAEYGAPESWMQNPTADLPNTLLAQAVRFGDWYADAPSKLRDVVMLENLHGSVRYVSSVQTQDAEALRSYLMNLITTAQTVDLETIKAEMRERFGIKKNVAETVFRGTVMQTFRTIRSGEWTEDTLLRLTGPPPLDPDGQGRNFCFNHYGEEHTLGEWREIAAQYVGEAGIDPTHLEDWVGGYNCRHGLREVLAGQEDSELEYREIQQNYLDEQERVT